MTFQKRIKLREKHNQQRLLEGKKTNKKSKWKKE